MTAQQKIDGFIEELNYTNENFLKRGMTADEKIEQYLNDACKGMRETKEFTSANILRASVVTTGYKGGDSGHGARTYISLEDLASTDMVAVVSDDTTGHYTLEIALGGDTEIDTAADAFEWIGKTLRRLANEQG